MSTPEEKPEEKSDEQIVADANELAREFYRLAGYKVPEGYRFDKAVHPQERLYWQQAVLAYEIIEGTPVEDALSSIEE